MQPGGERAEEEEELPLPPASPPTARESPAPRPEAKVAPRLSDMARRTTSSVALVVLVANTSTCGASGVHPGSSRFRKDKGIGRASEGCLALSRPPGKRSKSIVEASSLGGVPVFSLPSRSPASERAAATPEAAMAATTSAEAQDEEEEEVEEGGEEEGA